MKWLGIAGLVFGADFAAKRHLEKTRKITDEPREHFGGFVLVRRYTNPGGIMERFAGNPRIVRYLSAAAFGSVAWAFLRSLTKRGQSLKKFGLALMAGGGASNFYDRCTQDGVTDYLSVSPKRFPWVRNVVFNLADVAIFAGAFFTILGVLFGKKE